jgi:hypothetical protein
MESKLSNGRKDLCDLFDMELLDIGFLCLFDTFFDVFVYSIDEIIFRFDSMDDPVIHFIDERLIIASFL